MTINKLSRLTASKSRSYDIWLFLLLICAYGFVVQFGNLFRVSSEESVPGLSTAIVLALVTLGAARIMRALMKDTLIQLAFGLGIWIAFVSLVDLHADSQAWRSAVFFLGYVSLAAAISQTKLSDNWIEKIWLWIIIGLGLSAGLTIIDYLEIVNIPYNNELGISSTIDGSRVEQASGFFPRRSAMAGVFSLSMAGALVIGLLHQNYTYRLFCLGMGSLGLICLMLTHNRSGPLSVTLAVGIYVAFSSRINLSRRIRIALLVLMVAILVIWIMMAYFPYHLEVYLAKLSFVYGQSDVSVSDYQRVELFQIAVQSMLKNPFGNGFTTIPFQGSEKDPHNIITSIVWAAGIMGVIWLALFGRKFYQLISWGRLCGNKKYRSIYVDTTLVALSAWMVNNMTHNSLSTGLAWIFLGILINQKRVYRVIMQGLQAQMGGRKA